MSRTGVVLKFSVLLVFLVSGIFVMASPVKAQSAGCGGTCESDEYCNSQGECVNCLDNSHCSGDLVCSDDGNCVECNSNSQCTGPVEDVCNLRTNSCAECNSHADCASNEICDYDTCKVLNCKAKEAKCQDADTILEYGAYNHQCQYKAFDCGKGNECYDGPSGGQEAICRDKDGERRDTCGNDKCEYSKGESCSSCPSDCGTCSGGGSTNNPPSFQVISPDAGWIDKEEVRFSVKVDDPNGDQIEVNIKYDKNNDGDYKGQNEYNYNSGPVSPETTIQTNNIKLQNTKNKWKIKACDQPSQGKQKCTNTQKTTKKDTKAPSVKIKTNNTQPQGGEAVKITVLSLA